MSTGTMALIAVYMMFLFQVCSPAVPSRSDVWRLEYKVEELARTIDRLESKVTYLQGDARALNADVYQLKLEQK